MVDVERVRVTEGELAGMLVVSLRQSNRGKPAGQGRS